MEQKNSAFSMREANEVLHRLRLCTTRAVARESEKEGGSRDTLAEGKISVEVTDTHQCTETQKRHSEGHRDREENGRVRRVPFR